MNKQNLLVGLLVLSAFFALLLLGCTSSRNSTVATPTIIPIDESPTVEPTYTLSPISTPDISAAFNRCVNSGIGVRYVITGESVSEVSLNWRGDIGEMNKGDYGVPFCITYYNFHENAPLYITAQIIRPVTETGSIQCYIYNGNTVVDKDEASGFAAFVECTDSANIEAYQSVPW